MEIIHYRHCFFTWIYGKCGNWNEIIEHYLMEKYKIIAVDLIGHGKTTVPRDPNRYSMEEQIADLEALFTK